MGRYIVIVIDKDSLLPVKHSSLRENVYEKIKAAIMQRTLKPGQRLSEASLATRLGTSRTPIREALHRLESEGFIMTLPRRGSFVTDIDIEQIEEIYRVRGLLEGYAARKAAKMAGENIIKKLESLLDDYEKYLEQGRADVCMELDEKFHLTVLSFCGEIINHVLNDLRGYTLRTQYMAISQVARFPQVLQEHRRIVAAIKARDGDEADRLTREHMQHGLEAAIKSTDSEDF